MPERRCELAQLGAAGSFRPIRHYRTGHSGYGSSVFKRRGVRLAMIPAWIAAFGGLVSLIFAPFWTGLLLGEFVPLSSLTPCLESDLSCHPDRHPFFAGSFLVLAVHCLCVYFVIGRSVRVSQRKAPSGSLLIAAAAALAPVGTAALFTTSDLVVVSGEFVSAVLLCGVAAALDVLGGLARGRLIGAVSAAGSCILLVVATAVVIAVIPATVLAIGAILAWASNRFIQATRRDLPTAL